jgi:hypothetical protein
MIVAFLIFDHITHMSSFNASRGTIAFMADISSKSNAFYEVLEMLTVSFLKAK